MKTSKLIILFVCTLFLSCQSQRPDEEGSSPIAEYQQACTILMNEPGIELFDGVIHPSAALYEQYFDVDAAAREHENYRNMLTKNGIKVLTVHEVLHSMSPNSLRELADASLKYVCHDNIDSISSEIYRQNILNSMSSDDLVRLIYLRPTVQIYADSINTGFTAIYEHNPIMNTYFMRDQSMSTPKGQVLGRMNSQQRANEVDVVELCYKHLGIEPIYRIKGENSFLEGGDYMPFGTISIIGQGLRTSQGAIDELLAADVIGHDTLVVVRDKWKKQFQMHLDTYFNIIDKDLASLCFNRYDAEDTTNVHFLTIDMYARAAGEIEYHEVPEYHGKSFKEFLKERGVNIIRVSARDANHYAINYLTINARHIMSVAGQSQELQDAYKQYGVKVEWVPLDNIIGGYGAAHCMTQVIRRK